MVQLFSRDAFPYYALLLNGDRGPRSSYPVSLALGILLISAMSGFFAGRLSVTDQDRAVVPRELFKNNYHCCDFLKLTLEMQVNTRSEVFRYNRTFGEASSNSSNAAWSELFPKQGGFFKHPIIAPQRSAFAVFHQLHCLVRNVDTTTSTEFSFIMHI